MAAGKAPLAVVTGASSGLGAALAPLLVQEGYRLLLVGRRQESLQRVCASCGGDCTVLSADLVSEEGRNALFSLFGTSTMGEPSLLINSAGMGDYGAFIEADPERLTAQIDLNVSATTLVIRHMAERMKRQGRGVISTVASVAGFFPGPLMAVYYATKAYQLSLSQALDAELAPAGVRSLVVCPGPFVSSFHETAGIVSDAVYSGLPVPDASAIARYVMRSIRRGRGVAVPGILFRMLVAFQRLLPRRLVTALVHRQQRSRRGSGDSVI